MQRENSQQKSIRNRYGIEIKMCCASCRHKKIKADGRRVCTLMQILVRQQFVCPKWAVTDGLMNAGLQNEGIVRLKGTQEIVID